MRARKKSAVENISFLMHIEALFCLLRMESVMVLVLNDCVLNNGSGGFKDSTLEDDLHQRKNMENKEECSCSRPPTMFVNRPIEAPLAKAGSSLHRRPL